MIKKIDHIGIAVRNLDEAIAKYTALTGAEAGEKETVAEHQVETAFFQVGESRLELLKGTSEDSPISTFIRKRGGGIHHICLEVDDLDACKRTFSGAGLEFVANMSETGAGGSRVAFLHPRSTGGVLIELVQHSETP